jgi:hypothetical protein
LKFYYPFLMTDGDESLSLLLEKIDVQRTCADVDIPLYLCACVEFTPLDLEEAATLEPI